ncbi:hypothetical protein JCGZ_03668 [Jatropha curcas]|uniref:Uncharacterized protein n=1 Tax=Jatropha curcas TaxID=180498 RepID=A0A067JNH3_JATCU|nr:hypothetical protein JCGZ_03668 [Jatropha curcas]
MDRTSPYWPSLVCFCILSQYLLLSGINDYCSLRLVPIVGQMARRRMPFPLILVETFIWLGDQARDPSLILGPMGSLLHLQSWAFEKLQVMDPPSDRLMFDYRPRVYVQRHRCHYKKMRFCDRFVGCNIATNCDDWEIEYLPTDLRPNGDRIYDGLATDNISGFISACRLTRVQPPSSPSPPHFQSFAVPFPTASRILLWSVALPVTGEALLLFVRSRLVS